MDSNLSREKSNLKAKSLGVPVNSALPLLDEISYIKPISEILQRLLCLHACAACAYGLPKGKVIEWIKLESLETCLTEDERRFIFHGDGSTSKYQNCVEAMWALAWYLGLVDYIDFDRECDKNFVKLMPNLNTLESGFVLNGEVKIRSRLELMDSCDLAYCLHSGIVTMTSNENSIFFKNLHTVVVERRRAIEWLGCECGWDETLMDT